MATEAWAEVTTKTINNCFKKCLPETLDQDPVEIPPVAVPEGFTRAAWEAQINLEEFTESDVEQEVQILIETNQNMDPDPAENHSNALNVNKSLDKNHLTALNVSKSFGCEPFNSHKWFSSELLFTLRAVEWFCLNFCSH